MDYQLVIKFWRKSLEDEAFLANLGSELKDVLGDAVFDGYDTKPEEIIVFINTADPRQSFRRIKRVLEKHTALRGVSAGQRLHCPPRPPHCATPHAQAGQGMADLRQFVAEALPLAVRGFAAEGPVDQEGPALDVAKGD